MIRGDARDDGAEVGAAMAEVITVNLSTRSSLGILPDRERLVGREANEVGDASRERVGLLEVLQEAAATVLEGTGTFAGLARHSGVGGPFEIVAARGRCRARRAATGLGAAPTEPRDSRHSTPRRVGRARGSGPGTLSSA